MAMNVHDVKTRVWHLGTPVLPAWSQNLQQYPIMIAPLSTIYICQPTGVGLWMSCEEAEPLRCAIVTDVLTRTRQSKYYRLGSVWLVSLGSHIVEGLAAYSFPPLA
jgi:hypothetical protein